MIPSHGKWRFAPSGQATVDAYATLGSVWEKPGLLTTTIVINNTGGSNGVTYQIEGSANYDAAAPSSAAWGSVGSPGNIAASANAVIHITDYYPALRVRVKAQVGSSQTTASAYGAAVAA